MSVLPIATEQAADGEKITRPPPVLSETKTSRPKRKGQKLAEIHSKPLPLEVHPFPTFHPSNPVSLITFACAWISDLLFPPTSHPAHLYSGYFSPETRSVHITDPRCARALWEMGFFGKGTLSRSEPSWLQREEARVAKQREEKGGRVLAAEDRTLGRREERRLFKLERARVEHEAILRQRLIEEGKLDPDAALLLDAVVEEAGKDSPQSNENGHAVPPVADLEALRLSDSEPPSQNGTINGTPKPPLPLQIDHLLSSSEAPPSPLSTRHLPPDMPYQPPTDSDNEVPTRGRQIRNEEHLHLTLEEAFFLTYALGVLTVHPTKRRDPSPLSTKSTPEPYSTDDLLELFSQHSSFPPAETVWITPDDQFLLNYVAYHHFRSLGWVVRSGQKFAVDFLLYNRGPVFSHAEFAVVIVPAYTDRYWNTPGGRARRRVWEQKDWWWLHGTNRVQSRVFKTLVLCYIDVPSELDLDFDDVLDIGKLLRSYKVREFVVRRWLPNRSR